MTEKNHQYLIGVDGGGTKTLIVLADLRGRILKRAWSGSSNFINVGIKRAVSNIAEAFEKVLKKFKNGKILSTFIALSALEENKEMRAIIMKELLKNSKISSTFKSGVIIGSDQIAAFRSGTDKSEGIVVIAGTGCVVHGWKKGKEVRVGGWGYLNDEGSAFWVGQKAYQALLKNLDGRGEKTLITSLFLKKLKIKKEGDLKRKIYFKDDLVRTVSQLSIFVDLAAQKNDKIAKKIMKEGAEELALSAKTVIKKLNFQRQKFPLVLTGGMFKSKFFLNGFKKEIKKLSPRVEFIRPKNKPVMGALKLARESIFQ